MSDRKTIYGKGDDVRNLPPTMGTLVCKKGNNIHAPPGLIRATSALAVLWLHLTDTSKPGERISGVSRLPSLLTSLNFPLKLASSSSLFVGFPLGSDVICHSLWKSATQILSKMAVRYSTVIKDQKIVWGHSI